MPRWQPKLASTSESRSNEGSDGRAPRVSQPPWPIPGRQQPLPSQNQDALRREPSLPVGSSAGPLLGGERTQVTACGTSRNVARAPRLNASASSDVRGLPTSTATTNPTPNVYAGSQPKTQDMVASSSSLRRPSVSRPSVQILPFQLCKFRASDEGHHRAPSTSHATRAPPSRNPYQPRLPTYKDLPPNHPVGQLILKAMNQLSQTYRTHLEIAVKLDRMDPAVRAAYKNTLIALELSMRTDQDNIEAWETQLGLFHTPRII